VRLELGEAGEHLALRGRHEPVELVDARDQRGSGSAAWRHVDTVPGEERVQKQTITLPNICSEVK
jgi:hypothetical protein